MRASASPLTASIVALLVLAAGTTVLAQATPPQSMPQQMMPPPQMMPPQMMPPGACAPNAYPGACMPCGQYGMAPEQCGAPMGDYCGGPDCCDAPRWTFTADILALQRSTTRSQPLFQGLTGGDDLNSKYFDFPASLGFQASAIRHGDCGWDVEVGYFQIDSWIANAAGVGETYLVTDVNTSLYLVSDPQARYTSALHLGEINLRTQCRDWLTVLAGFRMGEFNERYSAFGVDVTSPTDTISMYSNSFNHLYGFQLGADAEVFNLGGPLRINALCKAGIYGNWASTAINQTDPAYQTDQTLTADRGHTAFMGEAGLVATYQLTCHLAFRASYQAVWLEGVALAPEQIGSTDFVGGTTAVNTAGSLFYHGGGLGLELKF